MSFCSARPANILRTIAAALRAFIYLRYFSYGCYRSRRNQYDKLHHRYVLCAVMLCNSYIVCNKINLVLTYPFNAPKNHFIFCDYFSDSPGQNYVDTSSRKAFLHINRTPVNSKLDSNDILAAIFQAK